MQDARLEITDRQTHSPSTVTLAAYVCRSRVNEVGVNYPLVETSQHIGVFKPASAAK